jgi:hypothetical protein
MFVVNPAPAVSLALQSISTPCPGENVTAVFAFNVTGLTPGAGALLVQALASSSAAGTACTVLSFTQTGVRAPQQWQPGLHACIPHG